MMHVFEVIANKFNIEYTLGSSEEKKHTIILKEDEMGRACGTQGELKMHTKF
jgi:hypothetical protein